MYYGQFIRMFGSFTLLLLGILFMNINQSDLPWPIRFFVMETDSMSPEIPSGSLLATVSNDNLEIGDVIAYKYPLEQSKTMTHRIVEYRSEDGVRYYQTKGDTNDEADYWEVREDLVRGKVIFSVPNIGYPFSYFGNPWLMVLLIFIPVLVIAGIEIYYERNNLVDMYEYFYQKIRKE